MKDQETEKYISLKKATEYCSYSQEYLSLRARQGKLKAIKFGRNWVTKKEWLNEYLLGIEEYNDSFAKEKKVIAPPKDLPTEERLKKDIIGLDEWVGLDFDFDFRKLRKALKPELQIRFGFVVIFTLSLIVTNFVFGQESFKSVYQNVSDLARFSIETVDSVVSNIDRGIDEVLVDMSKGVQEIDKGIDEVLVDMSKGAQEVVQGINNNIDRKATEIVVISKWVLGNISDGTANLKAFVSEMSEAYNLADEFLDKKVVDLGKETYDAISKSVQAVVSFASKVRDGYVATDNFVEKKILDFGYIASKKMAEGGKKITFPKITFPKVSPPKLTLPDFSYEISKIGQKIIYSIKKGSKLLGKNVSRTTQKIVQSYVVADEFVEEKLVQTWQRMKKFITPFGTVPSEVPLSQDSLDKAKREIIEAFQTEFKELKEEGIIAKEIITEVSRITKIEPIKEITKEIIKIDEEELSKLKAEMAQFSLWGTDIEQLRAITKKLQASPAYTPVSTAPIYIGYQGLQVGGIGSFASLGVSGLAGIGSLGVGGSATFGFNSSDTLTVNATSNFQSHVSINGNLTVTGSQTFSGPLILNVNSTTPALSITQSGTGDIISLSRTGGGSFVINEDGFIVGVGTLRIEEPGGEIWEMGVTAGKLTYTTDLTLASGGTGDIILDPDSGIIQAATGDVYYTEGGHPIRKSGEQLLREMIPIFGFDLPSRTASTTYITVSRTIEDYAFPAAMTGTTRVHKFVIRYADTATGGTSTWQVYNVTDSAQTAEFTVPNSDSTDINKGEAYIVAVDIPTDTDDWRLDVKVDSGSIQIYQIFLAAYDQVD